MLRTDETTPLSDLASELPKPERNLLKDQIVDALRDRILSGLIPPATPLSERELAEQLGVSRIPVRDALIQLEGEGLIVSKSNGRSVIQLTKQDIEQMYQVRVVLERLAARLAALNATEEQHCALLQKSTAMADAVARRDPRAYQRSDMEIHRLIWQASANQHLVKTLHGMVGPIFMLMARHVTHYDWAETHHLHVDLIQRIVEGDPDAAEASMERHPENARQRSLRLFAMGKL
jgi:DNA-binding GntR family transcriptional regulator